MPCDRRVMASNLLRRWDGLTQEVWADIQCKVTKWPINFFIFFSRLSTGGQAYPKNVLPQLFRCIERKGGEMVLGGFNGVRKVGPNEYGFALQGL